MLLRRLHLKFTGNTNADTSLARIPENEPLHNNYCTSTSSTSYQPYSTCASSVLCPPVYHTTAAISATSAFAPTFLQQQLSPSSTTTWSTGLSLDTTSSRKKKAVSFTNDQPVVSPTLNPALNLLFNNSTTNTNANFSSAPSGSLPVFACLHAAHSLFVCPSVCSFTVWSFCKTLCHKAFLYDFLFFTFFVCSKVCFCYATTRFV